MESDPIDTETVGEINQADDDANAPPPPPPETIIVKMRGRPAGSKNKAKAESSTGGTNETACISSRPIVYCIDEATRHQGGYDETVTARGEKGTGTEKGCDGPATSSGTRVSDSGFTPNSVETIDGTPAVAAA
jgi:hypothetical protein